MKQNPSEIQGVLRKLDSWQNAEIDSCERRAKRYSIRCDARLRSDSSTGGNEPVEHMVQIRDISRTGAGLLCSSPIEVGQRWRLQPIVGGADLTTLPVFCRHCREVTDGIYLIGVEFGIEAAILIALGVPPDQLNRDELADHEDFPIDSQFVNPSELLAEDEAA